MSKFTMKKVQIKPGCITCGLCEFLAPQVFEVTDLCRVRAGKELFENSPAVEQAAKMCPVQVIAVENMDKESVEKESHEKL